ncbi:hypothetical protein BGZ58_005137, partial [Dissophora ornata]
MSSNQDTQKKDLPENQGKSREEFLLLIQEAMVYKERSHSTYHDDHLPELTPTSSEINEPQTPTTPRIDTVLIGDSMLERLKTTGTSTRLSHLPLSFNTGCGGDKIENVLYRLSFMYPLLESSGIQVWVVMVGTNNLRKKGLRPQDVALYRLLLQALLKINPGSKILMCEIFKRKDIEDRYVEEANGMMKAIIVEMNTNLGPGDRIFWSEAPVEVTKERLVDH